MQSNDIPDRQTGAHGRRVGPPVDGNRLPMAAGRYYPKNASSLRALVTSQLDAVDVTAADRLAAAYVVPHAAIPVSGSTAAHAYARLRRHAAQIDRVVLLGPIHHADPEMIGCIVPHSATWSTPLGAVTIDAEMIRMLVIDGHAYADDMVHRAERSLEIQLPFLQVAVPSATLVPILVGPATTEDVLVTLAALADPSDRTVVIATTDLGGAGSISRTLLSILEMAGERITPRDACAVYALRGLIGWANHRQLRAELLARTGDHIACSFDEVVVPRQGGPWRP